MSEQLALSSGLKVNYESVGSGMPVICIPGWGYSTRAFENNLERIAKHYRAIAIDPRSQGATEVTTEGNDYGRHGQDLKEFIDALEIKECVLLGWSLGLYAVYAYLDKYGMESVRAVVAVDESPRIIQRSEDDWGEGNEEEINGLIDMVGSGGYLDFWRDYTAAAFINKPDDALLDDFQKIASSLKPEVAAGLLRDAADRDYVDVAINMAQAIPTLNILREEWGPAATRWIMQHQPGSDIEVFGGHLMLYEFADRFNERVLDFLKDALAR
jgi:pimeloyl-ACP methyl ester carboxylesterase